LRYGRVTPPFGGKQKDSPENRTYKFLDSKNGTNIKKLLDTGLLKCPFEMVENWINEPTKGQNMDYSDIYRYLV